MVAVLIALAIGGVGIGLFSQTLVQLFKGQKQIDHQSELAAISHFLLTKVSCRNSIDSNTCSTSGTLIELVDHHNNKIVENSGKGTKFGRFTLRAECGGEGEHVIVRANTLTSRGHLNSNNRQDFAVHPLTKKKEPWRSSKTLVFKRGIALCPINNQFERGFPVPSYASDWKNVPVTFTHHLNTTAYVVRSQYQKLNSTDITEVSGITTARYNGTYVTGYSCERMYHHSPTMSTVSIENWSSINRTSTSSLSAHRNRKARVILWKYDE